ncbi:MAG: magnesium chelatase ATPase subunit I [Pyrinomonadaceae bacterium]
MTTKQPRQRSVGAQNQSAMTAPLVFPFAALVGQAEMKLALLLNVIEPAVGGALVMGQRGTGKTTAVRALAELLPPLVCVRGCAYNCDSAEEAMLCAGCRARLQTDGRLASTRVRVPVVELPLNATEDRVCGTISFERALTTGVKEFEPGLLARANRGFLYIDEVNLLEDHLVDLLLDAAATGRNRVEREGISVTHPARFVLIGSGNPEEGELRPQLLDRFGLFVEIKTPDRIDERVEVIARHEAFARDPQSFCAAIETEQARLRRRITRARRLAVGSVVAWPLLRRIAELCQHLHVDGHRGELTIVRAARALAAYEGRQTVTDEDVRRVAPLALRHRLRRDPLEQTDGGARMAEAVEELFGPEHTEQNARRSMPSAEDVNAAPAAQDDNDGGGRALPKQTRSDQTGRAGEGVGVQQPAPTVDAQVSIEQSGRHTTHASGTQRAGGRHGSTTRASVPARRGRYVRATAWLTDERRIALAATLYAAASHRLGRSVGHERALSIERADLRFKQFSRRAGTLYIFAIDTSGSMALNRINQAKGALVSLLRQSYVKRDLVALISFREGAAQLLLRPSRSTALARRLLDALPVGGATPLAAGLLRAYDIARQVRPDTERITLLVFTDGRANVPLAADAVGTRAELSRRIEAELQQVGARLQQADVTAVIIDTRQRFAAGDEGVRLARTLGGRYVLLPPTFPMRMVI